MDSTNTTSTTVDTSNPHTWIYKAVVTVPRRGVHLLIHHYPAVKVLVKNATSMEHSGPSNEDKISILNACFDADQRIIVFHVLWKRISDDSHNWMHVYKALEIMEYLLAHDIVDTFAEIRQHEPLLISLLTYSNAKEGQHNEAVADKATKLLAQVTSKLGPISSAQLRRDSGIHFSATSSMCSEGLSSNGASSRSSSVCNLSSAPTQLSRNSSFTSQGTVQKVPSFRRNPVALTTKQSLISGQFLYIILLIISALCFAICSIRGSI